MRPPAEALVVDAAILIAVVLGRGSGAIREAGAARALITTDRSVEEARRRIELGLGRPELLDRLASLAGELQVVTLGDLAPWLPAAAIALRDTVPSRNGSTRDAHILALAWVADADIWTYDRDFAGVGVATWSTPNLMRALTPA